VSPSIVLSIVSHRQSHMIRPLLADLAQLAQQDFEVIITINLPEDESPYQGFPFPMRIIRNDKPKGFGANNNAAFENSRGRFFAVVNPDVRIRSLDFTELTSPFVNQKLAAVAPVVLRCDGKVEDNARRFPTLKRFAKRILFQRRDPDYKLQPAAFPVDWVAGIFVVFRPEAYRQVAGFDDRRFFMYLEDADICRRLQKDGWQVMLHPKVSVFHTAQRASHRNIRYMRWHIVSAFRYLTGL
jgi:N-acetylglucosaminyl-diphospho-decaprenol L-rhamnosyltransferase